MVKYTLLTQVFIHVERNISRTLRAGGTIMIASRWMFVYWLCSSLGMLMLPSFANSAPFAYIANRDDDTVSVIDTVTDKVVSTIAVGDYPHGLAVTPNGERIFVANRSAGTVSVIDAATRSVIATIATGLVPISIAVDPSGAFAYIVNRGEDKISIMDTALLAVVGTISVSDAPGLVLVHPTQPQAYIVHNATNSGVSLSVIDTQTRTVVSTLAVGSVIVGMALHPDGKTLYLMDELGRSIFTVDLATMQATSPTVLGGDPYSVVFAPDGSRYYVTDLQRNAVLEFDAVTNVKKREILVGDTPKGLQIHPDGKRLYVSNLGSATVSIIDRVSGVVTSSVNVGLGPVGTGQIFSQLPPVGTAPNVIFIIADDMRESDMAYMPNLQTLLVGNGIKFTNAFAVNATCCPARASILRGQYPQNNGITRTGDAFKRFHASGKEFDTLATRLRNGGYRTGLYGKYLLDYPAAGEPTYTPPGWDEWVAVGREKGYYNYELIDNGVSTLYGSKPEEYVTDVLSAKVQASIASVRVDKRPFFLFVAPSAPHEPAIPAPRHAGLFSTLQVPRTPAFDEADVSDKAQWIQNLRRLNPVVQGEIDAAYRDRLRTLQALDDMLAAIIASLQSAGVLDNTYLIFSSDQGFSLGEHRIKLSKGNSYEENIRVPFVVRGPRVAAGISSASIVLHTDILPSVLSLAGVPVPDYADGRSLLPLFGGAEPKPWRSRFLVDHTDSPLIDVPILPASHTAVRTKKYTYIDYPTTGEHELYDLSSDPNQIASIYASTSANVLQGLADSMVALKACAGATCVAAENAVTLTTTPTGTGAGTLTSSDGLIQCGSDCVENYAPNTLVTLSAMANAVSKFSGWSGACSGQAVTCTVTMDDVKSVGAIFTLVTFDLTTRQQGTGSGSISSSDGFILCGTRCTQNYVTGSVVTLVATANIGSRFSGWSGACSGTTECIVSMVDAKSVTGIFTFITYPLKISKQGVGSGLVSSSDGLIQCGASCSVNYDPGSVVTLTATPDIGSRFLGWGVSSCIGTGSCSLTMSAARTVSPTFIRP